MPYPPALSRAIADRFFWEADFSLQNAGKAATRADISYVAGCCFRCVACLTQCLFALNGRYWLNEKGSVAMAARFPRVPENYALRVGQAFAVLSPDPAALAEVLALLQALIKETGALLAG